MPFRKRKGCTNWGTLEFHDVAPSSRDFANVTATFTKAPYDRVVRAREETLECESPIRRRARTRKAGRTTLVLNSRSQDNRCLSFLTVQVSPSSRTILPNRMPRAYMFGIVTTYPVWRSRDWSCAERDVKLASVVWLAQQRYSVFALHRRRDAVAQEFRLWSQFADDGETVLRRYVKEGGDGRVVGYCM